MKNENHPNGQVTVSRAVHCGSRGPDLQRGIGGGGVVGGLLQTQADRPASALLSQQQQVGGCGLVVTPLHTHTDGRSEAFVLINDDPLIEAEKASGLEECT